MTRTQKHGLNCQSKTKKLDAHCIRLYFLAMAGYTACGNHDALGLKFKNNGLDEIRTLNLHRAFQYFRCHIGLCCIPSD